MDITPIISALHPLNALGLFYTTLLLTRESRILLAPPPEAPVAGAMGAG